MALAILMEEASLSSLGETGDLAFTEGADVDELPPIPDRERRAMYTERPSKKRRFDTAS